LNGLNITPLGKGYPAGNYRSDGNLTYTEWIVNIGRTLYGICRWLVDKKFHKNISNLANPLKILIIFINKSLNFVVFCVKKTLLLTRKDELPSVLFLMAIKTSSFRLTWGGPLTPFLRLFAIKKPPFADYERPEVLLDSYGMTKNKMVLFQPVFFY
jgi:hypothetical protein